MRPPSRSHILNRIQSALDPHTSEEDRASMVCGLVRDIYTLYEFIDLLTSEPEAWKRVIIDDCCDQLSVRARNVVFHHVTTAGELASALNDGSCMKWRGFGKTVHYECLEFIEELQSMGDQP